MTQAADGRLIRMTPKLNQLGVTFVMQLHMVMRTMQIHDASNDAMLIGTENLKNTINTLWAALNGLVRVQFMAGQLFVNDLPVRIGPSAQEQVDALERELAERELGGISFIKPFDTKALREFLLIFCRPIRSPQDLEELRRSLAEMKDLALELLGQKSLADDDDGVVKIDRKTFAIQTYAKAVIAAREFAMALDLEKPPTRGKLRIVRIVQDLTDLTNERVNFLVKLAAMKHVHDYVFTHAANTCVLSLVLGRAIGIGRLELVDLGTAALLANIPLARLPDDWPTGGDNPTAADRSAYHDVIVHQARTTLGRDRMYLALIRRLLVGYQTLDRFADDATKRMSLFARIIRVASDFDRLTTTRDGRDGVTPDEALRILSEGADINYDPTIVKLLINQMGLYPVGTVVRLESNETAVVYHNAADVDLFGRPWVKVVLDATGKRLKRAGIRNLATTVGPGGSIKCSVRAAELGGLDPGMAIVV